MSAPQFANPSPVPAIRVWKRPEKPRQPLQVALALLVGIILPLVLAIASCNRQPERMIVAIDNDAATVTGAGASEDPYIINPALPEDCKITFPPRDHTAVEVYDLVLRAYRCGQQHPESVTP